MAGTARQRPARRPARRQPGSGGRPARRAAGGARPRRLWTGPGMPRAPAPRRTLAIPGTRGTRRTRATRRTRGTRGGSGYPQDPAISGRAPGPPPAARRAAAACPPGRGGPPRTSRAPPASAVPGTPAAPPRGSRARRSGPVRGAQVAYVIVLAGLVAGLAYIWQGPHSVREGTFILAGALFVAVAARLALPERRAGMLASRRRYHRRDGAGHPGHRPAGRWPGAADPVVTMPQG